MNPAICEAIQARRVVRFYYGGGLRVVEPHCYGVSTAGHEVVRAYQISGYSQSGESVGWKLFRVSEISGLEVSGEAFAGARPGYNPNDSAMATIFCRL